VSAFSPRVRELLRRLPQDPPFDGSAAWFHRPEARFGEAELLELERDPRALRALRLN
jgi:hypothetical protein